MIVPIPLTFGSEDRVIVDVDDETGIADSIELSVHTGGANPLMAFADMTPAEARQLGLALCTAADLAEC